MGSWIKGFLFFLLFLSLGLFIFCAQKGVTKYLSLDETDISTRAHMINAEGPRGPLKELGPYEGIAHPPLYEYTTALIFRVFGEREAPLRLFGVFCFILISIFAGLSLYRLLSPEQASLKQVGVLSLFICLFSNPLLIQHSMLVDADTTWIALCVAAFMFVFVRYENGSQKEFFYSRFLLAFIVSVAFMSKEIAPLLLFSAIILYRIVNRQWKKLCLDGAIVMIGGSAVAWIAWGIYCYFSGTDFWVILIRLFAKKNIRVLTGPVLLELVRNTSHVVRWPVFWCSLWFFVLVIYCLTLRFLKFIKDRRLDLPDLILLAGIFIWCPYFYFKPSSDMMKYQYPAYPFLITVVIYSFVWQCKNYREALLQKNWKAKAVIVSILLLIVVVARYYYALGDYIRLLFDYSQGVIWKTFMAKYFAPVIIAFIALVFLFFIKRKLAGVVFWLVCFIFMFSTNFALGLNQAGSEYTTAESWVNYGEQGLKNTIDFLRSNVTGADMISTRKDIRYYLSHRFNIKPLPNVSLDSFIPAANQEVFEKTMRESPLKFIVIDYVSLTYIHLRPEYGPILEKYYYLNKRFGNFLIYKSRRFLNNP